MAPSDAVKLVRWPQKAMTIEQRSLAPEQGWQASLRIMR
jgi:hypothetical protein